ncbi:MAG: amino acid permease, partial [Bdellovibrio sp.]|nr:amino acid permease [Bdellovibrio sp.]
LIFVHFGATETTYFKPLTVPFSFSVIPAAGLVFFAYLGFESMVNLAEEAKDPEKNIPRAIFISLFFTTVIYVLVGLAALALMSPAELSNASAVLSEALQGKSPMAAKVLGGIALFSTGNTVMIGMLAGSRITLGMARRHDLPFIFSKIWGKKQTPWLASILIFALCLFFLPLGKVEIIASVSSLVTIAVFVVINCSVIYLRYAKPELKRPFRIPGSLGKLPLPSLLAVLASVTLVLDFSQQVYWVAAAIVGVILLVYGVMRLFKK